MSLGNEQWVDKLQIDSMGVELMLEALQIQAYLAGLLATF